MLKKEFEKIAREEGNSILVSNSSNGIVLVSYETNKAIAYVSEFKQFSMKIYDPDKVTQRLFKAIVDYASTPIDERVDEPYCCLKNEESLLYLHSLETEIERDGIYRTETVTFKWVNTKESAYQLKQSQAEEIRKKYGFKIIEVGSGE